MNNSSSALAHSQQRVKVSAPARLHLGFLDLNGSLGRKFGSIGVAVNSHYTTLEVCGGETTSIVTHLSEESKQQLLSLLDQFYLTLGHAIPNHQRQLTISLLEQIPEHAGLGSGTQLALTLGYALAEYYGINTDIRTLAKAMGRGQRSGIGIAAFEQGGFIIDGGLKAASVVPPVLMQQQLPPAWRIVMIMDESQQGVHGSVENKAFKELPVFPLQHSQTICHLTLMQLLPALQEEDIAQFGRAITDIQQLIGDHFATVQGGRYTSNNVASLLAHARQLGHQGIAQSSWGPTGCVFVDSESSAQQLISELSEKAQSDLADVAQLSLLIAEADYTGATIETKAQLSL